MANESPPVNDTVKNATVDKVRGQKTKKKKPDEKQPPNEFMDRMMKFVNKR